jgi:hypothetical protein
MKQIAADFLALSSTKRRYAMLKLCEHSLQVWESFYPLGVNPTYQEMVTGSIQVLEVGLPREAVEAIIKGTDSRKIEERYREPIVALQDMDLEFPDSAEFAYYSIYNAFRRYVLGAEIEEKLILNQALSALPEGEMKGVFQEAVASVG